MEKVILESYIYLNFQLVQNYLFEWAQDEVSVTTFLISHIYRQNKGEICILSYPFDYKNKNYLTYRGNFGLKLIIFLCLIVNNIFSIFFTFLVLIYKYLLIF